MKQLFLYLMFFCIVQCPLYANTYAVDNTADTDNALAYTAADGTNTLRKCIRLANANAGADIINFSVAGTITLTSNLPTLTGAGGVTIDGTTAPGYVANSNLTGALNGTLVVTISGAGLRTRGISIASDFNIIKGLNFINVGTAGGTTDYCIEITANDDNNQILGCYVGTTLAGTGSAGTNTDMGIYIIDAANNKIGDGTAPHRNLISGISTTGYGIYITGAASTGNTIKGNIIGLQKDGATFLATTQVEGIRISNCGSNVVGGTVAGEGNVLSGNNGYGLLIVGSTSTGNSVLGNIIGPQANGASYVASNPQLTGLWIWLAPNNIIGGSAAGAGNTISANEQNGINISGASAAGNVIKGNYIGLNSAGTTFITSSDQTNGIQIASSAGGNNVVGGTVAGEGNVISGNGARGIYLNSSAAAGNTVIGNIIGPRANGTTNVTSNPQSTGIFIVDSRNNTIGGSAAGARNIISANTTTGVYITGATSTGNVVKGNYIGLDINGTTFISGSSQDNGINIISSAASNTIGGTAAGEENVISGNTRGIYLNSDATAGNTVIGNIIGPRANGTTNVTSNPQTSGVYIIDSPNNTIGGSAAGSTNIISANTSYGVVLTGATTTGNSVKGNYIGLDITGTTFITSNSQDQGVIIDNLCASNVIGGTVAGEGNVLSGNSNAGVYFSTTATAIAGNSVLGNIIGPQQDGATNVTSNTQTYGIYISTGSRNNIIGTNAAGARNIISANLNEGVYIEGVGTTGNLVRGNYIGLDITGTTFIAGSSQDNGVQITSSAASSTIGGTVAGQGNVISGNTNTGIYLGSTAAAGNTVVGNIIGPQADGASNVTSNAQSSGIVISQSRNNTIGGSTAGARNIISANLNYGINITAASATGNLIRGNYLGLDINGTTFIASSSQDYGVYITASAASNTIGGTVAGQGNVISGNTTSGLYINSANTAGNTMLGNIIGPQANGTSNVASNAQTYGVYILGSPNNAIGGSAAGAKNIISANLTSGVYMSGAASTGNLVKGNYIGPGSALANIASSNQDYGVIIVSSAANNSIGGTAAGEGNTIAFNTVNGIYVFNVASTGNLISRNLLYTNTIKQINLNYGANQGNIGKSAPSITTVTTATVVGTGAGAGGIVEIFKNNGGLPNDATTYVGTATANGAGNWSLGVALVDGDCLLANATDGSNNTSEFSGAIFPLPVQWLYFNALAENNSSVRCEWTTATEMNNDYFAIERATSDNMHWEQIGTVKGAGNSSSNLHYEFIDTELPAIAATLYYRLRQVDYDGQYEYSSLRHVDISTSEVISVYPTLSSGDFTISFSQQKSKEVLLVIRNILGQEFYSKEFIIDNELFIESVNLSGKLAPGVYTVIAASDNRVFGKRIVIK